VPSRYGPIMTASPAATLPDDVNAAIEKRPLERYVAPAQPSLIGLSREQLADALAAAGVPERQRRMRAQQIWHWLYVRGATDFDVMTTLSKELRVGLARISRWRVRDRGGTDFGGRHAQVAAAAAWRG